MFLPAEAIQLRRSRVTILMHPHELRRKLRTVPLLEGCLSSESLRVLVGRRIEKLKDAALLEICADPENLLLYPSRDAVNVKDVQPRADGKPRHLIVLDGTWEYAGNLYTDNVNYFKNLTKVKLEGEDIPRSEYAIRKQPSENYLCTLEAVAWALKFLEDDHTIYEDCMRPLRAIVRMQHASHAASRLGNSAHEFIFIFISSLKTKTKTKLKGQRARSTQTLRSSSEKQIQHVVIRRV